MKIGLVVDGISERDALPKIYRRIRTSHTLLSPIKQDIQPLAPLKQMARAAANACRILAVKQVDLVVVLVDLENRDECPGEFARLLRERILEQVSDLGIGVAVVVKVRAFENWLVSDLECLGSSPGLFPDAPRVRQSVPVGAADHADALAILQQASGRRRRYHKVHGAVAVCSHLNPGRAALNSRSFRRFLRVIGDTRYADQSRKPAAYTKPV